MAYEIKGMGKALAGLAVIIALSGCTVFSGRETAGEYVDDSTVTTQVKAAIFNDPALKSMEISVETMQDVVQLSGFVDSSLSKAKAGEIASNIKGVRQVRNNLVVR